ncbi:P-loop containing nucleoside triphosphate hydrolase protein [Protomyces lactucae-debilis]|uniref:p-loop containing nucleoside triphosphate hydrolase protein n=1 Tax=Protomyces lactucae-debilis TaxID=2754530 RepID=A0A1Y2F9C8_PROLT|nr:P-loop containing nucleoside triphosphate hydrolase protein [Protomyces lactucae-debilis]ORY80044.1 P-loop containing nucleoside triphosphate hydrolase protein [Protomyces lactucae-debilis]
MADHYNVGQRCWFQHDDQAYVSGELTKRTQDGPNITLLFTDEEGRQHTVATTEDKIKAEDAFLPPLRNPAILEQGIEDLTDLSNLNTPSVLHAIRTRYQQQQIYTYSGIVLIAVNPFQSIPAYSNEWVQQYSNKPKVSIEPHLFAIAEEAYRCMKREGKNQTIIVSGESGAGKTVSAKYIMRYFATVEDPDQPRVRDRADGMSHTEKQILATNPIMEAFGNAKTTRNDNSSRFGKYIEILFDKSYEIIGAKIRTYLLERSRLNFQAATERNYHIFYQLCAGLNAEQKKLLSLEDCSAYKYLNQGGESKIVNVDDAEEFAATQASLTTIGVSEDDQTSIWRILAGLLHLGNVEITASRDTAVLSSTDESLVKVCSLLEIDPALFTKWLIKKQVKARNEKIESARPQKEALVVRDSITKFIYSSLFDWLVRAINTSLASDEVLAKVKSFIGVLDIYGFEHFQRNSFEQFCINYANEKLQQEFNSHVFKLEQEEYLREEIPWEMIDFSDNGPAIDLIEGKSSILSLLDEQCRLPSGNDAAFRQRITETFKDNPNFEVPKLKNSSFTVKHYALPVTYEADGFLEKNKDTLPDELFEVLNASKNAFFRDVLASSAALAPVDVKKPGTVARKPTLGSIFKNSLGKLMETIDETNAHYIRCIKPNEAKRPWEFEPNMVMGQMTACGVLETIRISCAGYPSRWTFAEFVERYFSLVPSSQLQPKGDEPLDIRDISRRILKAVFPTDTGYQIGLTKIFFKPGMLSTVEERRSARLHACALMIQKHIKGWLVFRRYMRLRATVGALQALSKGRLARLKAERMRLERAHAIQIQAILRGFFARRQYTDLRRNKAATTIQHRYRAHQAHSRWTKLNSCATTLQKNYKVKLAKREVVKLRKEQTEVRAFAEKNAGLENKIISLSNELRDAKREAKSLQGKLQTLNAQLESITAAKTTLETSHSDAQRELASTREQASGFSVATAKVQELLAKLQTSETSLEARSVEFDTLQKQLDAKSAALQAALDEVQEERETRASLQQEMAKLKASMTALAPINGSPETTRTTQPARKTSNRHTVVLPNGHNSEFDVGFDARRVSVGEVIAQRHISGTSMVTSNADKIMEILEDDDLMNNEIMYGMIQALKIPQASLQTPPSEADVLFPAQLINLIVQQMWQQGFVKESERFLANVMQSIQQQVMTFTGEDIIAPGAFWMSNVHEILSFVCMAENDILGGTQEMERDELQEYDRLIGLVKHDLESLEFNIYHTWLQEIKKKLSKMIIPATIETQSLPGFMTNEPSRFFNKLLPSSGPAFTMDELLNLFNKVFKTIRSFYLEASIMKQALTEMLKLVGVVAFNDLLMRRNFLSWKRGLQINYNITRIEEWCKSHDLPEGTLQLEHLMQATKLLQLKKVTIADVEILYDICWCLSNRQIHRLINQYYPADYENPLSPEILKAVAGRITEEERTEILLDAKPLTDSGEFEIPEPREIQAVPIPYVPSYLSLIRVKLLLKLVAEEQPELVEPRPAVLSLPQSRDETSTQV